MSARYLKKVLREQEQRNQKSLAAEEEEDEQELNDEEPESPDLGGRPTRNPFDLLNENDEDDTPDQEEESEVADETSSGGKQEAPVLKNVVSASDNKSKKKKKKKTRGGSKNTDKSEKLLDVDLEALSLEESSSKNQAGPAGAKSGNAKVSENLLKRSSPSILQVDLPPN